MAATLVPGADSGVAASIIRKGETVDPLIQISEHRSQRAELSDLGAPTPYAAARRALEPMGQVVAATVNSYAARRAMPDPASLADWDDFLRSGGSSYEAQRTVTGIRALIDRMLGRSHEDVARRLECDADELLAQELVRLAALDPRWGFLQLARSEPGLAALQHMVVGPGGIYLLNARNHPGAKLFVEGDTFLVNGHDRPYVSFSRVQASTAGELLSRDSGLDLGVTGVIVPIKDRRLTIQQSPDDVEVIERNGLADWLLNQPESMAEQEVVKGFKVARDATSWRPRWSE